MTQNILDEAKEKQVVYNFLEDDDDFEEFEQEEDGYDVDMQEERDRKQW